mmetsp:Transcript_23769/g.62141  ORF Transcript_23769/g.62141 Transcript_23769/m.62141 type:complete len:221 (-) Transcript_23769:1870-2532(-)
MIKKCFDASLFDRTRKSPCFPLPTAASASAFERRPTFHAESFNGSYGAFSFLGSFTLPLDVERFRPLATDFLRLRVLLSLRAPSAPINGFIRSCAITASSESYSSSINLYLPSSDSLMRSVLVRSLSLIMSANIPFSTRRTRKSPCEALLSDFSASSLETLPWCQRGLFGLLGAATGGTKVCNSLPRSPLATGKSAAISLNLSTTSANMGRSVGNLDHRY